ncbi:MAG: ADP-ribosylation factor-like protein [Promethearchaeota archaeon]
MTKSSSRTIIYIHDLSETDESRLEGSRKEFDRVLAWIEERGIQVPLLVIGNKIDLNRQPVLVQRVNLRKALKTDRVKNRKKLALTSASTGEGVNEAFQWLVSELLK